MCSTSVIHFALARVAGEAESVMGISGIDLPPLPPIEEVVSDDGVSVTASEALAELQEFVGEEMGQVIWNRMHGIDDSTEPLKKCQKVEVEPEYFQLPSTRANYVWLA